MLKVLHSSDLHGGYKNLLRELATQDFDVWIDTGDFFPNKTRGFRQIEVVYQKKWFSEYKEMGPRLVEALRGRPLISVGGNHDYINLAFEVSRCGGEAYHLNDGDRVEVRGHTFAGFREINWIAGEWNGESHDLRTVVDRALDHDPDVLVTHAPPQGILDSDGYGIGYLTSRLMFLPHKVRAHLFGHTHDHGGRSVRQGDVWFHNGATKVRLITIGD